MRYDKARYINENMVELLLAELVEIPSPYFLEKDIMDFIYGWLTERDLPAQYHHYYEGKVTKYNGINIVGTLKGGSSGPTVLLNGHADTVNQCEGWSRDPLRASIEDNRLYGLGALDMKSGVTAILLALNAFKQLVPRFKGQIQYTIVSDEEGPYGLGTDALILDGTIGKADIAVVTEPSSAFSGRTFPCLCLGARGGWNYTVTLTGKASHAANPELGINAISDAARVLLELEKSKMCHDEKLGRGDISVIGIAGGGAACSVADRASFTVFRHSVREESRDYIEQELHQAVIRAKIQSTAVFSFRDAPHSACVGFDPYIVDEGNPYVDVFKASVQEAIGCKAETGYFSSIGDFNYIGSRLKIPTLVFGPHGANYHMPDEYVELDSVKKTADVLFTFLVKLLAE